MYSWCKHTGLIPFNIVLYQELQSWTKVLPNSDAVFIIFCKFQVPSLNSATFWKIACTPPYTMLKVGKILDICIQRCLWDGERVTAWACVIWKKRNKWKAFPRHVHNCREDHTHLISDLWPGSVTEDTQDESTGLRVTEWNWMELFWSDNSTCVKTRKITKWSKVWACFIFYHSNRHLQLSMT